MKLSVIIVSYNVKFYLEQCLTSLLKAVDGIQTEVFVVDNHSRDGSVEYLRRKFRGVNFVASNHNLGFAKANNLAIGRAKGEYILLLNPDTIVGENTIKDSITFMDAHQDAGGLGVKMLRCDGTPAMESRRGLPTPLTAFYKMCGLCQRYPKSRRFGKYYMSYLPWDEPVQIEVISGAYCMLRKEAIDKTGPLDEDFFMYGEDIDLSYRLLKAGYTNWYLPSPILHYKGESTQKSSFRYVHVFYEAMLIFFRKHYRHLSLWLSIPVKTAIYLKASLALLQMQIKRMARALGFVTRDRSKDTQYLFIGSKGNIASCKRLARDKGLVADFVACDKQKLSHNDPQVAAMIDADTPTFVVYDTDTYNYDEIFSYFESNPKKNVQIGTFHTKSHTVITLQEIIR